MRTRLQSKFVLTTGHSPRGQLKGRAAPLPLRNPIAKVLRQAAGNKFNALFVVLMFAWWMCALPAYATKPANHNSNHSTMDRLELVKQQISLLTDRLNQGERELADLQQRHDSPISSVTFDNVNKSLLEKASLDISVAKSNLDSITLEDMDSRQTIVWLEKSIQDIQSQLNVLSIFGLNAAKSDVANLNELHSDLSYQQNLLQLEKQRLNILQVLQSVANTVLALKNEDYNHILTLLRSDHLLHIKQQQVKDELFYQQQQNAWLRQLNTYYARLANTDPVKGKEEYASIERDIYYANENANYSYFRSLIARYDDQIQQMKIALVRSSSISLLNEISDQYQDLNKQIDRLDKVLKSKISVLEKHIDYLSARKKNLPEFAVYIQHLSYIVHQYQASDEELLHIQTNLSVFRRTLDQALQTELASRQGFPAFGVKTFFDLGKEMLLVPTLTFQIVKSLSTALLKGIESTHLWVWSVFALGEAIVVFLYFFLRRQVTGLLAKPSKWREKINTKWLSLQWLQGNLANLFILANMVGIMSCFQIAFPQYLVLVYLSLVSLACKSILTIARLCLVETTHDAAGKDMRLYRRLRFMVLMGGIITAFTVFVHQLPLIYELKMLCDRLFFFLLTIISLLLLRSYDVVPNLILTHMENKHPYWRKSVRLIGLLIPLLILGNSIIGVCGFVNLIRTVAWYEGIFLIVLIGYLILRGLLTNGMEQLSRLMIQYVHNGWLWTEAFLKPLDTILRITLFLTTWAVLFLFYGWDKRSPIVERLTGLLHYKLLSILNTTITPTSVIELCVVISIFYWTARWTREFVYRLLLSRTKDMGIRNSIAILSQYTIIVLGVFFCLRVLGIDLRALAFVSGMFAFGIGLGLRDLANNFACGFLILLERPLRVGDIVNINGIEGEVAHIGGRAVTVKTWDYMELVVPNAEIFNKSFTNWTAKDTIVRSVIHIKISRYDNPHEIKQLIQQVLAEHKEVLKDPLPEVFLKEMNDTLMEFEIRYYVNIRQVKSRMSVISTVLMRIWDIFTLHGIKPPFPQQEIVLKNEMSMIDLQQKALVKKA